jgi:hypothetical protein
VLSLCTSLYSPSSPKCALAERLWPVVPEALASCASISSTCQAGLWDLSWCGTSAKGAVKNHIPDDCCPYAAAKVSKFVGQIGIRNPKVMGSRDHSIRVTNLH